MYAAIFDMDGTLVDNNPYHFKTWKNLFEQYNRVEVTPELYNEKLSGVPGMVIMREFFADDYTEEHMKEMFDAKTLQYKQDYAPYVAPVNGLERFLTELKHAGVKLAVASSATASNIDFILSKLPFKHLFDVIIDGPRVSKAKPNPQIFLKAAEDLGVRPENCVVFEDSLSGVKAGNAAGMKVIGITTSHTGEELQPVHRVITDYSEITERDIAALFEVND
ncbi:HAD family hydrolase [Mucilaginibacter aquatilis]|uniref:Beta-phosphoglucomutase n=1 Tax=Mucilaginibacter aquatilis TaxID=1517760 RepID=A0A6I4I5E6_9SPHI|nr:HAD family phosphatase [Mucilaginibacter aquatilis]MVN90330.1 beta-phosphoglucomutase family hydrolase [Mucilaginibacter aquatilis]